jgi:hypothetical protein
MGVKKQLFEVTKRSYVDFLQNELSLLLEEVPLAKKMHMVFQHDGAPAHYSRLVTHNINPTFSERWISCGGHVHWPPRFPRLYSFRFLSVEMDERRSLQIQQALDLRT